MHGQNINLPVCVCVCVCVSITLSVNLPTGQTPQWIFKVDSLKDADLCKDVPFGGLDLLLLVCVCPSHFLSTCLQVRPLNGLSLDDELGLDDE